MCLTSSVVFFYHLLILLVICSVRLLAQWIMCRFGKIFFVLFIQWWILILNRSEVNAYEYFKDILNPVNVDLNVWHQRNARVAIRTDAQLDCERPNMYTCEEPPNLVHPDAPKTCSYRNVRYHEQVFRWVAGRGCLMFTPDFLFTAGFNNISLNAGCFYENLFAPCVELPKEDGTCGCYPFDPGSEEVAQLVREAIVPSAHGRWERCFYAASDCCSHDMLSVTYTTQEDNCGATFDGWTCWHATEAGSTAFEVCPEFAYSSGGPSCQHFSSKQCLKNATWELQTDYSTCSITSRLLRRYRFHIVMLSFSIISCLPAVIIFCFYDRLRITRIGFHRNILITIIVRNILVIISKNEIYIDEITNAGDTVISGNSVACRLLSVAERLATNMVFACMLVEGIFLHRLVVAIFRPQLNINLLYGIGAVLAVFPVSAWAVMMILLDDHSCWLIYTVEGVQWVLDAPRIFILLLNTVLFLDVFRVLLTRIRNPETAYQLSTTKATLFLLTIFGTQFLLTMFRPNTTNCTWEQMYYYVAYTVEGLQGFIVAMLHCYVNKEVHILLKNANRKTECAVVSNVRRNSSYPRMSIDSKSERRLTCSTTMPIHIDDQKNQYATIAPKLHVAEIISIQASERLADILEPVYETIENGACNGGYDSLERSSVDNDSGFIANRDSKGDNYYGFTHVSSVSIDCQDWIKCISSPSSSVYNNSLNEYETRYLERKFPNHPKFKEIVVARKRLSLQDIPWESDEKNKKADEVDQKDVINRGAKGRDMESNYENSENMLEEILQYIETNDNVKPLNIDLLYPNMNTEQ